MSDDLIKRLTAKKFWGYREGSSIHSTTFCTDEVFVFVNPDGPEAADRIAALEAQLAYAKDEFEEIRRQFGGAPNGHMAEVIASRALAKLEKYSPAP